MLEIVGRLQPRSTLCHSSHRTRAVHLLANGHAKVTFLYPPQGQRGFTGQNEVNRQAQGIGERMKLAAETAQVMRGFGAVQDRSYADVSCDLNFFFLYLRRHLNRFLPTVVLIPPDSVNAPI